MRIPVLGGPTAGGKTALALLLAEWLTGPSVAENMPSDRVRLEVISSDAMMVYRGMDVGTAKPTREERLRVPHHLVDIIDPWESFSVADWVRRAEGAIADVLVRGQLPMVVGGTGFYIRALTEGLPSTPPSDPEFIAQLELEFAERGLGAMIAELEKVSPTDALRAAGNKRRVLRALEVWRMTGRPPSDFPTIPPRFSFAKFVLLPPRDEVAELIAERTRIMFTSGLLEETAGLSELFAHTARTPTALQAIGYREAMMHLRGEISLEQAMDLVNLATRAFAKRQGTWFRAEPAVQIFEDREALRISLERCLRSLSQAIKNETGPS